MDQIIYSRISENRDSKFLLKTIITEGKDGFNVIKSPVLPEGHAHCLNHLEHANNLRKKYEGSKIKVVDCVEHEDGVQFSFIKGDSLECKLNNLLLKNDIMGFVKAVQVYFNELTRNTQETFAASEQMIALFGDLDYPKQMDGITGGNLDAIFSNVKYDEKQDIYTMFDYEWTMDFSVPSKYILFRALFWYQNEKEVQEQLHGINLFKLFDFSEREMELFLHMEENFQSYVRGCKIPLWQMYERLNTTSYTITDCLGFYKENHKLYQAHIYYDLGQGYTEEQSFFFPVETIHNKKIVNLKLDACWQKIRIDLCDEACVISDLNIWLQRNRKVNLEYTSNGIGWGSKLIMFLINSPQIECELVNVGDEKLCLEYAIDIPSRNFLNHIDTINHQYEQLVVGNAELIQMLSEKEARINEKDMHIDNITNENKALKNSRLLKLSRKLKKILPIH